MPGQEGRWFRTRLKRWVWTGQEPEVEEYRVSSVVEICSGQCWDGRDGQGWLDERGEATGPKTNGDPLSLVWSGPASSNCAE